MLTACKNVHLFPIEMGTVGEMDILDDFSYFDFLKDAMKQEILDLMVQHGVMGGIYGRRRYRRSRR